MIGKIINIIFILNGKKNLSNILSNSVTEHNMKPAKGNILTNFPIIEKNK